MVCRHPSMERPTLPLEELVDLSILFARAVDYRSPHTAAHSVGVGASARAITGYTGFSERERQFVQVAGRMHDIGKLCVPPELLEKEDRLTAEEERTVREHTYHTYCLLDGVQNLDTVKRWAAYHHERVNGDGYPFHMAGDSLSLGARAVAVADVFTALTESRPHRKRLASHEVRRTLGRMAHDRLLDRELTGVLIAEYDEIEGQLLDAQRAGAARYREIARKYPDMMQ
jgi:HD-GYP domain-containing protein (c-di-GMP phosphodiesterase class II)